MSSLAYREEERSGGVAPLGEPLSSSRLHRGALRRSRERRWVMKDKPLTAVHIVLDFRNVDASDTVRDDLNNAITTMAPSSPMWASQVVKDEVANLGTTHQ